MARVYERGIASPSTPGETRETTIYTFDVGSLESLVWTIEVRRRRGVFNGGRDADAIYA